MDEEETEDAPLTGTAGETAEPIASVDAAKPPASATAIVAEEADEDGWEEAEELARLTGEQMAVGSDS